MWVLMNNTITIFRNEIFINNKIWFNTKRAFDVLNFFEDFIRKQIYNMFNFNKEPNLNWAKGLEEL